MGKTRKSKTGKTINELDKPITLKLHTKCPDKYILIDTETGQFYVGNEDSTWTEIKG